MLHKNWSCGHGLITAAVFCLSLPVLAADPYVDGNLMIGGADLRLGVADGRYAGAARAYDHRALVHGWEHDELFINFDNDYSGGVKVTSAFTVQEYPWSQGGQSLRILPQNGSDPEIGSSTGRIVFWHDNHGYTDLRARDIEAETYFTVSDLRLKENVRPLNHALETVSALRGVTYRLKDDADHKDQLGLIAQEVETVLPQLVSTDDKGMKSVAYSALVPLLLEAIKTQQQQLDNQQARISALEQGRAD